MKGFKILEDILLFFVRTSTSDCDSAATAFLDDFLGFAFGTNYLTDVVSLGVVDCLLC